MSAPAPTAADFFARNRAGGLFTMLVSQRVGSYLALAGHRLRQPPSALTLFDLVIGLAASIAVIMAAPGMAAGRVSAALIGLVALVVWQLAYALDCADGQLARVTGQVSLAGGRLDILADIALQISLITAVSAVATAYHPTTPSWLIAAFAGTWMVNLVTSVLQTGDKAASLIESRSLVVQLVKLVRDYGAVVTVIGLGIAFVPQWTVWLMVAFTAVNGLFLLVSIAAAARASVR